MIGSMTQHLAGISAGTYQSALRRILRPMVDQYSSQPLTSAGLVIKAGASALAKIGAADFYAVVKGSLLKIAASTDMPALTGITITAANFNVVCFYVDAAGVVTALAGTQAATLGGVVFPQPPNGQALVGFLIITHSATFTGGTTALDTATTVYVSPLGVFDATVLV